MLVCSRWRERKEVVYAERVKLMAIFLHYCYFQTVNLNTRLSVKASVIQDTGISSKNLNGTHEKVSQSI